MLEFIEVGDALEKVLKAIKKDRNLLLIYPKTALSSTKITAENLSDLAGNHLFDDYPGWFGITEEEAHRIRAYFELRCISLDYIPELHKKFPEIMEEERPEYLEHTKKLRIEQGLGPLSY